MVIKAKAPEVIKCLPTVGDGNLTQSQQELAKWLLEAKSDFVDQVEDIERKNLVWDISSNGDLAVSSGSLPEC